MSLDSLSQPQDRKRPSSGAVTDVVVPSAMLIVAVAFGTGCHMHLGFPPEFAAAIGLALFCIMLLSHVLLRPDTAKPETRSSNNSRPTPSTSAHRVRQAHAQPPARPASAAQPKPSADTVAPPKPVAVEPPPLPLPVGAPGAGSARAPAPPSDSTLQFRAADLKLPVEQHPEAPSAPAAFRPTFVDEPAPRLALPAAPPPAVGLASPSGTPSAVAVAGKDPSRLAEQQRVQQILHKLAAQIKNGAKSPPAATTIEPTVAPATAMTAPTQTPRPPPIAQVAARPIEPPAPPLVVAVAPEPITVPEPVDEAASDSALAKAVSTLLTTVESMRGIRGTPPLPRAPSQAEVRLAAVAEALHAERTDVYLQPILALKDDTASHFEVSVRLRTADGLSLDRDQVSYDVRGAGLLPLLDAIGIRHSADFALKLERKGRAGSVLSQVGGESLESTGFVNGVAARSAQGVADRLVLAFDQEDIRGLGIVQLAALAELKRQGFRFAIERLAHLDMDFEKLQIAGFAFIKLDASVFSHGLDIDSTTVPAGDLCRFFRDYGLDVIVGRIEHEAERQSMIEHGVLFGQGALFGDPRAVSVGAPTRDDGVAA